MSKKRKQESLEEFKDLIDSRKLKKKEREEESEALLKAREARHNKRSESEIKAAKLMQLKYQMEAYLNNPEGTTEPAFPQFLSS